MGKGAGAKDSELNIVSFSETFTLYYTSRYSQKTVDKIDDFIDHFEKNGLFGNPDKGLPAWQGKVSPSWNVPESYTDRHLIESHARKFKLWHAHIGDPVFIETYHGKYKVSDWVIHFQLISNKKNRQHIKLLDLGFHDPMELPTKF
jgi:hypothetical protein